LNNQSITERFEVEDSMLEDMQDAIDHGIIVSYLAGNLTRELGMDESFCNEMARAGMVHDIGKLKLGEYLYGRRRESLKIEEMKYVRMHPTLGYEILKNMKLYPDVILEGVYHHHENFDGSGYPSNLSGFAIPVSSRILRICDVFAALVSERPYRAAFDIDTAVQMMIDEVKNFDMKIFLAFLRIVNDDKFEVLKNYIKEANENALERKLEEERELAGVNP